MSIARNSAFVLGSRIAVLAITLATGIVLNRLLGAAGRGLYVLATILAFTQLQNLVSLGLQVSNQVFAAQERGRLGSLHAWSVVLSVAMGGAAALGVWVFWDALTLGVFRGIAPLHLALVTAAVGPAFYWMAWQGLMIGLGEVRGVSVFSLGVAIVQNGALVTALGLWRFVFPETPWETVVDWLVVLFVTILTGSVAVMVWMLGRRGALWGRLGGGMFRRLMSFGGRVYIGNYASGLLGQLDQIALNAFVGLGALGVYNQAANLAMKVWLISAAIESSAYAPVSGATKAEARRLTVDLFRVTLWISLGLIAVGWVASPLIPWVYGPDFADTVAPFRLLLLGTAVFGCGRMFSMYFTGNRKSPQTLLVLNWILVPIHANLCLWLVPTLGLMGGAVATTSTYVLSMTALLVLFVRDGRRDANDASAPGTESGRETSALDWKRFFVPQAEDWRRVRGLAERFGGGRRRPRDDR